MNIQKALIPVAGFGTRMLPATKSIPKEMLPIAGRPAISYIIEEIIDAGITTVILVQGRGKTAIEDFFDISFELETHLKSKNNTQILQSAEKLQEQINVFSVRQKKPLGLGHAIFCGEPLLKNEPFVVLLPDEIILGKGNQNPTKILIDHFKCVRKSLVGLMSVPKDDVEKYGIASLEDQKPSESSNLYKVRSIVEKPKKEHAPSTLSCCGRYIFEPSSLFKYFSDNTFEGQEEIGLTNAMNQLAKKDALIGAEFLTQKRYDIGHPWGWLHANIELAFNQPELVGPLKKYLSTLTLK